MMSKQSIGLGVAVAIGCISLWSTASSAQTGEFVTCHTFPRYVVVERPVRDGVGTDFLIKYRDDSTETTRCDYRKSSGDFEIKNEFAEYFAGFLGDLLILDSGTGPDRGLIIWNLISRKMIYTAPYSEPLEVGIDSMRFWTETGKANHENCPELKEWEAQGFEAVIETRVTLRLPDLKIVDDSGTRCHPRQ